MNRFNYIIILLILFLLQGKTNTQVSQEWAVRYHFYSNDQQPVMALDNAGNIYIAGKSEAPTPNGAKPDYATIKYNSAGIQQWVQRYNGPGNDFDSPSSIAVDDSGNVYVTGTSNRFSFPSQANYDIATIKYNTNGVQQWVRRYQGGGDDAATAGIVYYNGFLYVGGRNNSIGSDYLLIEYNSNGDSIWVRFYDSGGSDNAYDYPVGMDADAAGSIYMAGSVGSNGSAPDWTTVKWDSEGVYQWSQRYNGPGNSSDYPYDIAVNDSGFVYITGGVWRNNHVECTTIKYDLTGKQQWVIFTGFSSTGLSITSDDTNNVYVAAASNGYLTIKYNSLGVQQWAASLPNSNAQPSDIKLDSIGNVYLTGYTTVSANNTDYCTIKYSNSGVQQWVMYYAAQSNSGERATALELDNLGNVYVTGTCTIGNNDFATVKYSQTIGIEPITNEIPNNYKLEQNYPNPFNPNTVITFQLPAEEYTTLTIYDILGRKIATLVNQKLKAGKYEVSFDGSSYSSGIYFYKLQTEKFIKTLKLTLIK